MGKPAATKVRPTECCASVLAAPLDTTEAAQLASRFSALGDPVRLRVLSMLAASPEGEVCVCRLRRASRQEPTHGVAPPQDLERGGPCAGRPTWQVGLVLAQP